MHPTKIETAEAMSSILTSSSIQPNPFEYSISMGSQHLSSFGFNIDREDLLSINLSNQLCTSAHLNTYPQIKIAGRRPDIISTDYHSVNWALQAKHYSPNQSPAKLPGWLRMSIAGPINDTAILCKELNLSKFQILQLQTEISGIIPTPLLDATYKEVSKYYGMVGYWLGNKIKSYERNTARVIAQKRIPWLVLCSAIILDRKCIYGFNIRTIPFFNGKSKIADIQVKIHFIVSEPKHEVALIDDRDLITSIQNCLKTYKSSVDNIEERLGKAEPGIIVIDDLL